MTEKDGLGEDRVTDKVRGNKVSADKVSADEQASADPLLSATPLFSVVKGHPTDEELAAVLAVLSASSGGSGPAPKSAPSGWSAYWRAVRTPLAPGSGAWSASARR